MKDACRYADRPLRFLAQYVTVAAIAHAAIVTLCWSSRGCSVGAQYGVKVLVDTYRGGSVRRRPCPQRLARPSCCLVTVIAADNLLWRLASWTAINTFVASPANCAATYFGTSPDTRQAISPTACPER